MPFFKYGSTSAGQPDLCLNEPTASVGSSRVDCVIALPVLSASSWRNVTANWIDTLYLYKGRATVIKSQCGKRAFEVASKLNSSALTLPQNPVHHLRSPRFCQLLSRPRCRTYTPHTRTGPRKLSWLASKLIWFSSSLDRWCFVLFTYVLLLELFPSWRAGYTGHLASFHE